jgi:Holliday junction DNA helicase RuvA
MIVAVEGILVGRGADSAVVKVGSLSLEVRVPISTLDRLGAISEKVYLHTHLYLREDNIAIYGFASAEESGLFKHLISVSGIGPKAALGLLSMFSPDQLVSAVINGNVDLISQGPGIGKKTAGRIVLELKGKLEKGWVDDMAPALMQEDADVVAALTGLGYSLREASQAVSSLAASKEMDLEQKVRMALQQLAKGKS